MIQFQYAPEIWQRFPTLTSGIILASGMQNTPTPPVVVELFQQEQQQVRQTLGEKPLSEIPALSAWRSAFRAFNVEPTKYRSAPEALLRRLTKEGNIPNINLLVDLGNLISIRYALPIAVVETRYLTGTLTVRFADGSENYKPLGQQTLEHPEPGEVIFADDTQLVTSRRWCWRQSEESAATLNTTEAIITIEAQHSEGQADVEAALRDLVTLLEQFAGGTFHTRLLTG